MDTNRDDLGVCNEYEEPQPFSLWDVTPAEVVFGVIMAGILYVLACIVLPFCNYQ